MQAVIDNEPTAAQRRVLEYIKRHRREHGVSPTVRDMQRDLGMSSPNGVMCHLKALMKKGLLRKHGFAAARSWIPVEDPDAPRCSCCGQAIPEAAETG